MRLRAKVPHGHWKTTTFLAALRHDRIEAPWLLDNPIDGESFRTYVEKVLVPTLRPGDIVVMDNLGSRKGKAVRQLIRKHPVSYAETTPWEDRRRKPVNLSCYRGCNSPSASMACRCSGQGPGRDR